MIPSKFNKPLYREIYEKVFIERSNCFIGITGKVNTGKSETAGRIGFDFTEGDFNMERCIVYNVNDLIKAALESVLVKGTPLDIDEIENMSLDEIEAWLMGNISAIKIKPGRAVIFDEAGTEVYIREFFSKDNKTISKLIQIWRFLRLVVIVVVPENMNILESTISRFLDIEIKMLSVNKQLNIASAICYRYTGWNKIRREPYKMRITGCRGVGYLSIRHWDREASKKYKQISHIKKIRAIIGFNKVPQKFKKLKVKEEPNTECHKCNYRWFYSGKNIISTCPNCHKSTTTGNIIGIT